MMRSESKVSPFSTGPKPVSMGTGMESIYGPGTLSAMEKPKRKGPKLGFFCEPNGAEPLKLVLK